MVTERPYLLEMQKIFERILTEEVKCNTNMFLKVLLYLILYIILSDLVSIKVQQLENFKNLIYTLTHSVISLK